MLRRVKCLLLAVVVLFVSGCGGGGGGDTPTGDVTVSLSYSPPAGTVGVFYKYSPSYSSSQSISEHFELSGGSLPPGLGLSAGDGVISGTPTTPGSYFFTVTLTAKNVSGSIARSGSITILAASGGGSSSSFSSSSSVSAGLNTTVNTVVLGGANGRLLADSSTVGLSLSQAGSYSWTVAAKPTWLVLSKSAGTVGTSTDSVTLSANQSLLAVGSQSGTLTFQAVVGASTMTKSVTVAANLDKRKLIASEVGVAFAKTPAWSRLTRTLTVRDNYGSGSWTATSDQPWLTVTSSGSSGGSLVLTADPTGLPLDQIQTAKVTLSSPNGASAETISVGLWNGSTTPTSKTTISAAYTNVVSDPVRPLVYVNSTGSAITIYNVYTGANVGTIATSAGGLNTMEMSQDGTRLYARYGSGIVEIDPVARTPLSYWAYSGSWSPTLALRYIRPNGEGILIVGSTVADTGHMYRASTGGSMVANATFTSNIMAVSPDQRTLVATTNSSGLLSAYAIDYSAASANLLVTAGASSGAGGLNTAGLAISLDGASVVSASGFPYSFSRFSLPNLGSLSSLAADYYPNNIRVASDGRIFGGITNNLSALKDFWVYRADGSLHSSYLLRGSSFGLLPNQLVPSGDALMAIAITDAPNLQFIPVGP